MATLKIGNLKPLKTSPHNLSQLQIRMILGGGVGSGGTGGGKGAILYLDF